MMAHVTGNVWIGTAIGILKGVCLDDDVSINYMPANTDLKQMDRSQEMLCMCWGENKSMIYVGLKNGHVQCFDCERNYFCSECDLSGSSGYFINIARHKETLITCTNEGVLSYWPDTQEKSIVDVGNNVYSMSSTTNKEGLLIATGGRENDLKLWDGNRPDAPPIFKARNVPHDYLDLRVPVWIRVTGFVPGNSHLVAVATAYHQLRLYDTRAQRRPVYSHSWGEAPFTCMDITNDGRYYIVGNGHGGIARVDMRKGDVLNKYHGFNGSVRGIGCYDDAGTPLFGACGLDRYFRAYTMESPSIIYKKYMKLFCNCILVNQISKKRKVANKRSHDNDVIDDNDVWDQMDLIKDKKCKKSS